MNTKNKVDNLSLEFLRHKRQTELILQRYNNTLAEQKKLKARITVLESRLVDELSEVLEEFKLDDITARVAKLEELS